jgi:hypothetical protein
VLPSFGQLNQLIECLEEPISTAVWLVAVSRIRPEDLAFQWKDLDAEKRELWVVRAVNRGKLHTPQVPPRQSSHPVDGGRCRTSARREGPDEGEGR